jgi:hypothetical protein
MVRDAHPDWSFVATVFSVKLPVAVVGSSEGDF